MYRFRDAFVILFHVAVVVVSFMAAFWIRFDFALNDAEWAIMMAALTLVFPIKLFNFFIGGLHQSSWRHASLPDLARIGIVNVGASAMAFGAVVIWVGPTVPRSAFIIDLLICFLLNAGGRYWFRMYHETIKAELSRGKGVLIYGAGSAGRTLLREIRANHSLGFHVVGFIDDNPAVQSMRILDVKVLGGGRDVARLVERYQTRGVPIEEVIIAMPSATGRQMREAHASCRAAGVPCRTIPGMSDLLNGKYLSAQLRNIALEDLLGREQIRLEEDRIQLSIAGKCVLVTGAAGSIGSELCRQTARFSPSRLVMLDQAESELFAIDQELRLKHPDLDIVPIIGDIREIHTVEDVIRNHGVQSVYHAAAYKHVPMMEAHVLEAAVNNVIGTWNLVQVSRQYRVGSFVMISSDKAVNPTSVMGLTKRIAELIVSAAFHGKDNATKFVSVRFGNVLGSNGSVVPIFRAQIAAGGPVTVTHPEMRRYFMSIREAVQLVLQASTMGNGCDIFVLDMGEPVRILDLAHNLIHLAGLTPDEDIEIRITGLRPGEKLFEEIALEGENIVPTYHEKIRIFTGPGVEPEALTEWLAGLQSLIEARDAEKVLQHLAGLVPEYNSHREETAVSKVLPASAAELAKAALGAQAIAARSA